MSDGGEEVPLCRTFTEVLTTRFGGNYESFIYSEGQRRELEAGAGLEINIPGGFQYTREKFDEALQKVRQIKAYDYHSIAEVKNINSETVIPSVDVKKVEDVWEEGGWNNLADDLWDDKQFEFTRKLVSSGKYRLRRLCQEDEIRLYRYREGEVTRLGVESGQHRVMAAKILAEMGCEVKLVNVRVLDLV